MSSTSPFESDPRRIEYLAEREERRQRGDPGAIGEMVQEGFAQSTPLGWLGIVKDPMAEAQKRSAQQASEAQLAGAGAQATMLRSTQADLVKQLMNQDPTTSRGFQQALQLQRGEIGRSLGASGLGDSPFAAALQGQGAGQLAADFDQRRMQQLFQALGINSDLAASPELSAKIMEMLSQSDGSEESIASIIKLITMMAAA